MGWSENGNVTSGIEDLSFQLCKISPAESRLIGLWKATSFFSALSRRPANFINVTTCIRHEVKCGTCQIQLHRVLDFGSHTYAISLPKLSKLLLTGRDNILLTTSPSCGPSRDLGNQTTPYSRSKEQISLFNRTNL
jgi:hypothetical protein